MRIFDRSSIKLLATLDFSGDLWYNSIKPEIGGSYNGNSPYSER